MTVHEEEYQGLRIRIMADEDPMSPRDWDNMGNPLRKGSQESTH